MRAVRPVSPGEILEEEFLKPLGLSKYRLAKDIGVPAQRIGDIVAGKRAITADTDLRLCRYFGLADGWWLRGQANYDTAIARETMGDALARIQRCPLPAEPEEPKQRACKTIAGLRSVREGGEPGRVEQSRSHPRGAPLIFSPARCGP
jgi:addiction module HigA family antidote